MVHNTHLLIRRWNCSSFFAQSIFSIYFCWKITEKNKISNIPILYILWSLSVNGITICIANGHTLIITIETYLKITIFKFLNIRIVTFCIFSLRFVRNKYELRTKEAFTKAFQSAPIVFSVQCSTIWLFQTGLVNQLITYRNLHSYA